MRKVTLCSIPKTQGFFHLELPRGAQPIDLYEDKGETKIALLINDNASLDKKEFLMVEKEQPIDGSPPKKLVYFGSFTKKEDNKKHFIFEVK